MPNPPFIDAIATCPPPHDKERVARANKDLATAAAEAIVIDAETGMHLGGADPRTQGAALGPTEDD